MPVFANLLLACAHVVGWRVASPSSLDEQPKVPGDCSGSDWLHGLCCEPDVVIHHHLMAQYDDNCIH